MYRQSQQTSIRISASNLEFLEEIEGKDDGRTTAGFGPKINLVLEQAKERGRIEKVLAQLTEGGQHE